MPKPIRRGVTRHTPEAGPTVLWVTDTSPASCAGNEDAAPAGVRNPVPPPWRGGTIFRVVDFPPASRGTAAPAAALAGVHHTEERSARHPGFHQTNTIDYAIV